ncbi:MAG: hypothetical protein RL684_2507 [Pseudomonadota bacterium]|jgi:uncharacterized membrane-anchored protein
MRQPALLKSVACLLAGIALVGARALAADAPDASAADTEREKFAQQLRALNWVKGPATVELQGNSQLKLPEGYVYLDAKETARFETLTENLGDGREVLVAPNDLRWSSFLEFDDGGYVKDDDKIDAPALLKSLQESNEQGNEERQKRGWNALHLTGWASPPAYNKQTRRLEWATVIESDRSQSVNFFTKVLGRRGHTSIVMVASPAELAEAQKALDGVLDGYGFKPGDRYTEWKPGDKVAEYGLAALVLGGAAAVATKKGLWAVLAGFFAAAWKALVAVVVGIGAWLRKRFGQGTKGE